MLPLGLGVPLHRTPWVTIFILIVCTLKYFHFDQYTNKNVFFEVEEIYRTKSELIETKSIRKEFCLNAKKDQTFCENYSSFNKSILEKTMDPRLKNQLYLLENQFQEELEKNNLIHLESYAKYKNRSKEFDNKLIIIFKENHFLTQTTQSIKSYLNAIFSHADITHLLGNMLALAVFGIFVELKMGTTLYFLSYLFAGFISSYVFTNYYTTELTPMMGASGCIAGIMGMFYVYFFHHYLKFWTYFTTILLPVKIYFPILYILNDILLQVAGNSGVAAMAHISGMAFGILFAFFSPTGKTKYPFIYTEEMDFYNEIKNKFLDKKSLTNALKWLKYNPINFRIREKIVLTLCSELSSKATLEQEYYSTLITQTQKLIGRSLYYNDKETIINSLKMIPIKYSLSPFLGDFNSKELTTIYNMCLVHKESLIAMRLVSVVFERKTNPQLINQLLTSIYQVHLELGDDPSLFAIFNQCRNEILKTKVLMVISPKPLGEIA
jgi:membrane associated rhomboid family serine protease